jgi:polar amino acid transport system substrate-binding protein
LAAQSVDDLKTAVTGVKRDDVVTNYLLQHDFDFGTNLLEVTDTADTVRLLLKGRVDYIPATPLIIQAVCQSIGCKPEDFKRNFTIHELPQLFYLAASLDTSPELIERLQRAAASLPDKVPGFD